MVTKNLECAILSLLRNVPVWIFNLTVLAYFTSFAYSNPPAQPDRPACCQPRILNPHWIFSPILLVYFTFGPTTFGPSQPRQGVLKNIFTIFVFFHFHIVQQLGNFALIEDSTVKVKTMTNTNIIISRNQNRKMKNMFEKYLAFWVYYLYAVGVVYIHVKSGEMGGVGPTGLPQRAQPLCKGWNIQLGKLRIAITISGYTIRCMDCLAP